MNNEDKKKPDEEMDELLEKTQKETEALKRLLDLLAKQDQKKENLKPKM